MIGTVYRISANAYEVRTPGGMERCRLAGKLSRRRMDVVNLVAVGDRVEIGQGTVQKVLPRRNRLSRHDVVNPLKEQVIAANVDRILITQSIVGPALNPLQIDRCIVMSIASGIPFDLVVNKIDLLDPGEIEELLAPYRRLKYMIHFVSARSGHGLAELAGRMSGKGSVFMGPSGSGKTSLINALDPSLHLKTGEVSWKTGEGTHTTSWAECLEIAGGIRVIDTPGLEFFTLWGVDESTLAGHFQEFRRHPCRFADCRHLAEPECGVLQAVERGSISPSRHDSYRRMLKELSQMKKVYRREGRRRVRRRYAEEE
jgi:ribosome biogenesis GTPase